MRIAYFLDLPHGLGGAGSLLLKHARLMKEIHDVVVVIPQDEYGVPNAEYVKRCELSQLPWVKLYYLTAFNFYSMDYLSAMENADTIENFLREKDVEFVHSIQLNVALECATRNLHIPHLMSIYQLTDTEFRLYSEDIYPHYHLCDSLKYCASWEKHLPIKSRCLRPLSPVSQFRRKKFSSDMEIRIMVLGRVCPRKNQLTAIRIVEEICERYPIKMSIIGELVEEYAKECMDYVTNHGLQDKVYFYDFVSDVLPLMEQHDMFLCASTDESFPSSIVEAVSMGLPVVTTKAGGISEVFSDQDNAFVSEDFTKEAIKFSVVNCIEAIQNSSISSVLQSAEDTWDRFFSRDSIGKELDNYYNDIKSALDERKSMKQIDEMVRAFQDELMLIDEELSVFCSRILYIMKFIKEIPSGVTYIWGAGKYGSHVTKMLLYFRKDITIGGYVDKKANGQKEGRNIIPPDELCKVKCDAVVIAYKGDCSETERFLNNLGYTKYMNMWIIN